MATGATPLASAALTRVCANTDGRVKSRPVSKRFLKPKALMPGAL
nr:MAG TPA: hypothetical protein [Caudoviricetes sp.]